MTTVTSPRRVLLAYDLSPGGERAVALVAGADWPAGTTIRVVSSPMGIGPGFSSFATLSETRIALKAVRATIDAAQERVARDLRETGAVVETRVVHGRPERAILGEAERFGADLIVVGARDQGPLSATFLGSVSRAVVESASSPVLVARGSAVSRVVVAADGSPAAALAARIVASLPLFARAATLVVGVGDGPPRYGAMIVGHEAWQDAHATTIAESAVGLSSVVEEAAALLAAPGRKVEREIRLGDPATEVVAASRAWAADLVAIGANEKGVLQRLVLGSVARKVIDGVRASVLVARLGPEPDDR